MKIFHIYELLVSNYCKYFYAVFLVSVHEQYIWMSYQYSRQKSSKHSPQDISIFMCPPSFSICYLPPVVARQTPKSWTEGQTKSEHFKSILFSAAVANIKNFQFNINKQQKKVFMAESVRISYHKWKSTTDFLTRLIIHIIIKLVCTLNTFSKITCISYGVWKQKSF